MIGPDGARACDEIVAAARTLFAERGYYDTSVDAIARASGRSDTAFYQYFQSKLQVFRIFVEELGVDLADHFEAVPVLDGGPNGLAQFESWVDGLGEILRRHSPVFTDYPLYTEDQPATYNPSEDYMRKFTDGMQVGLARADTGGLGPRVVATAIICLVEWAHITADAGTADGRHDAALHGALARIVHQTLFPIPGSRKRSVAPTRPLAPPTRATTDAPRGLRKAVGKRGWSTVDAVCDAALKAFERRGLTGTSVNDVIAGAGIGHGTFYQYWTGRDALFATLADRAVVDTGDHFAALAALNSVDAVDDWLEGWLRVIERHGTVFHIWTAEIRRQPTSWPAAKSIRKYLTAVTDQLLHRFSVASELDTAATTIVLWTLLTEFPYTALVRHPVLTREQVLQCQKLVLVRGILRSRETRVRGG